MTIQPHHASTSRQGARPQGLEGVEAWRGLGPQKMAYQKWPDQSIPIVNLVFFPRWSLWSGGGGALPVVVGRSRMQSLFRGQQTQKGSDRPICSRTGPGA